MTDHLFRAWRFGVGVIVLLIVLVSVDPAAVGSALANADPTLALVGVIGLTTVHLVPAAGWRAIHGRASGAWLPWRRTIALFYAAQAIGGVTPANVGGDVHRAAELRRSGQQWDSVVAPLLVQRATSYLALSAIAIGAAAFLAVRAPMAAGISLAGAAVAVLVAVAAWLLVAAPGRLRTLRDRLMGGESSMIPGDLRGGAAIGIGTGFAFHAAAIGLTAVLVLAVDPTAPVMPVLAALAVARLALAVPFTPSGLGVQEGVLAVLFTALGIASGVAVAGMLLARLSLVLTTVIGVVTLIRSRSSQPMASRGPAQSSGEEGGEDGPAQRASSTGKNANLVRG